MESWIFENDWSCKFELSNSTYKRVSEYPCIQQELESNGNRAISWDNVYFMELACSDESHLREKAFSLFTRNMFEGISVIVLDCTNVNSTYNCIVVNNVFSGICLISTSCRILNSCLCNTIACSDCRILNCCEISCDSGFCMPRELSIAVGPENAGRELNLSHGMKYVEIVELLFSKHKRETKTEENTICSQFPNGFCFIGSGALLNSCKIIRNSIIKGNCDISSSSLTQCLIVGDSIRISHDCVLRDCFLHSFCQVERFVNGEKVFMMEHSSLSDQALVVNVVLAPDASRSNGETHHSVLGPMIGAHHQGLIIALLWPLGRGNMGYGAQVGANHTSRVNDQEGWMGEGMFVGLNSQLKLPFNGIDSPYSIIATGTSLNPQRIRFPFSLIASVPELSRSSCIPGWVLRSNPYFVERNLMKYRSRSKSLTQNNKFAIFRPLTMDMITDAKSRLQECLDSINGNDASSSPSSSNSWLSKSNLAGLGDCVCQPKDVELGIYSYETMLHRYSLQCVLFAAVAFLPMWSTKLEYAHRNNIDLNDMFLEIPLHFAESLYLNDSCSKFESSMDCYIDDIRRSCEIRERISLSIVRDYSSLWISEPYLLSVFQHQLKLLTDGNDEVDICLSSSPNTAEKDSEGEIEVIEQGFVENHSIGNGCDFFLKIRYTLFRFLLKKAEEIEKKHLEKVCSNRNRDSDRGIQIIEDYEEVNDFSQNQTDSVMELVKRRVQMIEELILFFQDDTLCTEN